MSSARPARLHPARLGPGRRRLTRLGMARLGMAAASATLVWAMTVGAGGAGAGAAAADRGDGDAQLQARVMQVAEGLRCLVCQNETIAASQASLAVDLRAQIRAQLLQGQSEEQVRAHLVARYGDFVLYRPPLKASTALLWFGPFALLLAAGLWALLRLRRQRQAEADAEASLPPALAARADALLGLGAAGSDIQSGAPAGIPAGIPNGIPSGSPADRR